MILESKIHGTIEYEENDIIVFKKSILGFSDLNKFILFDLKDNAAFKVLHSIEDTSIGFIVINPFDFFKEYEFKLNNKVIKNVKIEDTNEVMVLNTITINNEVKKITTNLRAPIIININKSLGEQIVLESEKYKIKEPLVKE
ncbi:flagellar assembly protein FliW [Clostridium frigidicarnis]|uniref:Flagellar assembly factor FliW n=1 Tax=Clostridium frigidicarnis TaxID=84698 RepID=A0A1I0VDS5_9CLOT|nr:flagellar assembly protein FliW [Clostridium frigidicarnis]SFA74388.1 flagellar assembly factor FliW [Clostridium frigidicarnis]